jgi:phosphinothricin acetyltransferase
VISAPLVRPMSPADAGAVLAIFQAGLDGGDASFETEAPSWPGFDGTRLPAHRLVAVDAGTNVGGDANVGDVGGGGGVLGWAAVTAVSWRSVYRGVVEHSVYVDPAAQGRGVGRALLLALIDSTEAAGIWTIQSGVFPENASSLALHAACGFRVVGTRERIGRHLGRWRDVVLIERRSHLIT